MPAYRQTVPEQIIDIQRNDYVPRQIANFKNINK